MIMVMIMVISQPHQSTKCTQHVGFKLHVARQNYLLHPSKQKANVQKPSIAKQNLNQRSQLAHSVLNQKVKEMSYKRNFLMRNSRIVYVNFC